MQTVTMTVHVGRGERLEEPGSHSQLTLCVGWTERDPLTVELTLTASPPHPSQPSGDWVILRDFLLYGLSEPTGDGAVRVRPGPDPQVIVLELIGQDTPPLLLVAPALTLQTFIDCTQTLVPSGDVSEASLDAMIIRSSPSLSSRSQSHRRRSARQAP
jgi:Streptomyces sporulation and cell division protein, SsgA